jgi:cbb3-type cytochrome oxidase subunit 1
MTILEWETFQAHAIISMFLLMDVLFITFRIFIGSVEAVRECYPPLLYHHAAFRPYGRFPGL